jgi:hypothetical protein
MHHGRLSSNHGAHSLLLLTQDGLHLLGVWAHTLGQELLLDLIQLIHLLLSQHHLLHGHIGHELLRLSRG